MGYFLQHKAWVQEKEIAWVATLFVEAGLRISLIDLVMETLGPQLVVLFQEVRGCNLAGGSCYQRLALGIHCLALHSVLSLCLRSWPHSCSLLLCIMVEYQPSKLRNIPRWWCFIAAIEKVTNVVGTREGGVAVKTLTFGFVAVFEECWELGLVGKYWM